MNGGESLLIYEFFAKSKQYFSTEASPVIPCINWNLHFEQLKCKDKNITDAPKTCVSEYDGILTPAVTLCWV